MHKLFSFLFAVVLAASAPLNLSDYEDKADIYAKSSDSINASEMSIEIDGNDSVIMEFPYKLEKLKEGTYKISSGDKTYKLHIDNTAPTITATKDSGAYSALKADFNVSGADEIEGTLSQGETKTPLNFTDGKASLDLQESGEYVVSITAKDKAGNVEKKTFNYTIHKNAPIISFTGLDKETQNSDYNIKVKVTSDIEVKTVSVTLDGKAVSDYSNIKVADEGEHTLKVVAEDIAGNKSEETKKFTLDKTKPTVTVTGVSNGDIKNTDISYSVTASDSVKVVINGKEAGKTGTISEDGEYTMVVTSTDSAGNEVTETIKFTIDRVPPAIEIKGIDNPVMGSTVNYTITADGDITAVITGRSAETDGNPNTVNETKTGKNTITGSLSNNGEYTITVDAVDAAGNVAEKKIVSFIIDKKKPEISISGVNDGEFYNSKNVSYKVSATDISALDGTSEILTPEVFVDGKESGTESAVELAEGVHEIRATVKDSAGNTAEKKIKFEIDVTKPEVSISDTGCVNDLTKIDGNGTDKNLTAINMTAYCEKKSDTKDNSKYSVTAAKGPVSLKHDYDGESANDVWTFTVTATDKAGNKTTKTKTVIRDTVAPKINLAKVKRHINTDVHIDASSDDPNPGYTKLYVDKDGKETEKDLKTTLSAEGDYVVTVKAADAAGNKSEESIKFTIDKTPPKTSLDAPSGHHKSVSKVSAKSNEAGTAYMTVTCDGKKVFEESGDKDISCSKLNKDGEYTVSAYSIDLAGNKSATETQKFVIDSTAPVVALTGIKDGSFANKAVTITAEVNERFYDTNDVTFTYNGTKIPFNSKGTVSKTSKTFNKDGVYEIKLFARDKAGNVSQTKTLKFTLDTKKPEITISAPDQGTYDTVIAPKVMIKDEYFKSKDISLSKNVAFKDSFGKTGGTRAYVDIPKLKENDGIYTLTASATDEAGNVSTATKTFIVNRFGSVFKLKSKPSEYSKRADSDVVVTEKNVSGIDSYTVKVFRDAESFEATGVKVKTDGNITTYTIPKSNFEKDGIYKVVLTTKDKAGNTSKSKLDYKFIIDNAAPVITYTGIEPDTTYQESSVKMYVQATDTLTEKPDIKVTAGLKSLEVKEDDNGRYVEIPFGYNQNIKISATDKAGNSASTTVENVSVSTSKLAPVLAHKKLAAGVFAGLLAAGAGIFALIKSRKKDSPDGDDIVM